MAYDKPLRIERVSSAGIVLTHQELQELAFPDGSANINTDAYPEQAERVLKDMAARALAIGSEVCGRADCKLECAGTSLVSTQSIHDGDLTARCTTPGCPDIGVLASYQSFNSNLT